MAGGKLKKLAIVAAVGAAVAAVLKTLRGDEAPQFSNHPTVRGGPTPVTPEPTPAAEPAADEPAVDLAPEIPAPAAAEGAAWVDPVDGECPDGYPIKAKLKSGIFHQPGGTAYARTAPDRCYASAEAAEADGLRAAKR